MVGMGNPPLAPVIRAVLLPVHDDCVDEVDLNDSSDFDEFRRDFTSLSTVLNSNDGIFVFESSFFLICD